MITLYRTNDSPEGREIESALKETCLAHKVVDLAGGRRPAEVPDGATAPVLVDDGQVFRGTAEILPHLEELVAYRERWYKYQSDACYCDENGNIE